MQSQGRGDGESLGRKPGKNQWSSLAMVSSKAFPASLLRKGLGQIVRGILGDETRSQGGLNGILTMV